MGWIGVDLDGTLAKYDDWIGVDHIGEPVPLMLARVREWLAKGADVRIFTARVGALGDRMEEERAVMAIREWCTKYIGKPLPITCQKDYAMVELWDDRCIQVIPNTGRRVDGADE